MNLSRKIIPEEIGAYSTLLNDKSSCKFNALLFRSYQQRENNLYYYNYYSFFENYFYSEINTNDVYVNKNKDIIMNVYNAIMNDQFQSYLKNTYSSELSTIAWNKEVLSSYIYRKRSYSELIIGTGISNISFLTFYLLNKDEADKLKNYKFILNGNESEMSKYKKQCQELKRKYLSYTANSIKAEDTIINVDGKDVSKLLDFEKHITKAVDGIVQLLDSDEYMEFEFDNNSEIWNAINIVFDHLVATDNKKELNKLFIAMHAAHNKKNKLFFYNVYEKTIKTQNPILIYSNNPKLYYYYLIFYKYFNKGKYMKKVLKHNTLELFLLTLKSANVSNLNLSKLMPKFEVLFNQYKDKDTCKLNIFMQADALLNSTDIPTQLDILEQNTDLLYNWINNDKSLKINNTQWNNYFYRYGYAYDFNFSGIGICDIFQKINLKNPMHIKKFWKIIENVLLNYKIAYKRKVELLTKLKSEIPGFDDFALEAAPELQKIICETIIS